MTAPGSPQGPCHVPVGAEVPNMAPLTAPGIELSPDQLPAWLHISATVPIDCSVIPLFPNTLLTVFQYTVFFVIFQFLTYAFKKTHAPWHKNWTA